MLLYLLITRIFWVRVHVHRTKTTQFFGHPFLESSVYCITYTTKLLHLCKTLILSEASQKLIDFVWLSVTLYHCYTRFENWKTLCTKFVAPFLRLYLRLQKIFEYFVWLSVTLYHCCTRFEKWKNFIQNLLLPLWDCITGYTRFLNVLCGFLWHCITVTLDLKIGKHFVQNLLHLLWDSIKGYTWF